MTRAARRAEAQLLVWQLAVGHDLPSLLNLGFSADDVRTAAADARAAMPFVGGEAAGLARVREYIW